MTDKQCKIVIGNRTKESCSVTDFIIKQKEKGNAPLLAWAEPDPLCIDLSNSTGRHNNFIPLVGGIPSWPDDLPLIEARLFWQNAALHVVAEADGSCMWVMLEELTNGAQTIDVVRRDFPVMSLRDCNRFGLADYGQTFHSLSAIEYRQHGRLIAWRLIA